MMLSLRQRPAPIYQLSPELLSHIFVFLRDLCETPSSSNPDVVGRQYNLSQYRCMLDITHVCRLFRDVALGCQSLWTNIPLYSNELASLFLQRSGNNFALTFLANLVSTFTSGAAGNNGLAPSNEAEEKTVYLNHLIKLISENLPRIRTLQIRGSSRDIFLLFRKLDTSAPYLHEMNLINTDGLNTKCRLPATIIGGSTPTLEVLELHGVGIKPGFMLTLTNLRRLKILFNGTYTSLQCIGNVIANNSRLEELTLLDLYPSPEIDLSTTINLPLLRYFVLGGDIFTCSRLIHHIVLPQKTSIRWHSHFFFGEVETLYTLAMPSIKHLIAQRGDMMIELLSVYQHRLPLDSGAVHLCLRSSLCHACPPICSHGLITIDFVFRLGKALAEKILRFCRYLPVSSINGLCLSGSDLNPNNLDCAIGNIKNSESIIISNNPSSTLLRLFIRSALGSENKPGLWLPPIRNVIIEDCDLEEAGDYDFSFSDDDLEESKKERFLDILISIFREALNSGSFLREVQITKCKRVTPERLDGLKEVLPKVTWDGVSIVKPESKFDDNDDDLFDQIF